MGNTSKVLFAMGNEAFAAGAIAAGARFYGGYPITPSSEIAEYAARELPKVDGIYAQMEDEIGSMASIIGASSAGVKAFTATSGPGFSLMQEPLGIAILAEVPCVVANVQRNGPGTNVGTKPAQGDFMQARWGTHGDHSIIAISPASVQECYDYAITAFNYAEQYRTPVIFLMDGVIGHLHETYTPWEVTPDKIVNRKTPTCLPEEYLPYDIRCEDGIPAMAPYGSRYLQHLSGTGHDFNGVTCVRVDNIDMFGHHYMDKIEKNRGKIAIVKRYMAEDMEYPIITFGCSTRAALASAKEARKKGIKAGVLQLVTIWPLPVEEIVAACQNAKAVVVPEMNYGQLVGEVQKTVRGSLPVIGIGKVNTETIKPGEILKCLEEVAQ